MGCSCGLLGKKHKKRDDEQAFAVRPVHTYVQGGTTSYQSGGGGGYPQPGAYNPKAAANRAIAGQVASVINKQTGYKYEGVVKKGADLAAKQYTQYEEKQRRGQVGAQPQGHY